MLPAMAIRYTSPANRSARMTTLPFTIEPTALLADLTQEDGAAPLHDATWYRAAAAGAGLEYHLSPGALEGAAWLTADLLLDGDCCTVFLLQLQEGQDGPCCQLRFALLPQASARLRLPLAALTLGHASLPREGALLNPTLHGDPVQPAAVQRLRLLVAGPADQPARWCMTPLVASAAAPLALDQPLLPRGPLLDALGQSAWRDWPGKATQQSEVSQRLHNQLLLASAQTWPRAFTERGAWQQRSFAAAGWFRTHHDGRRWWFVDPDGNPFWSAGLNGLRSSLATCTSHLPGALDWSPDVVDYEYAALRRQAAGQEYVDFLQANLMSAFGPNAWHGHWSAIALACLRRCGFNTIGHDSEFALARESQIPWTRTLQPPAFPQVPAIWRDLPDVYDPRFVEDARALAEPLHATLADRSLIGYFLMDCPAWSLTQEPPAAGMLFTTDDCHSRRALLDFLRERHGDEQRLSRAWQQPVTFHAIRFGRWSGPLSAAARQDLADFSVLLISHYFTTLNAACRHIDPHHLNLGPRWAGPPPDWCLQAALGSDVFSMRCDTPRVSGLDLERVQSEHACPVLISAWGVGALDAGLPASGPGPRVADQARRGAALRYCLENAMALPACVGLHVDALYDRSALGDGRGATWNCGLLDVCHRPADALMTAARQSLDNLYPLVAGQLQPFPDAPPALPPLAY